MPNKTCKLHPIRKIQLIVNREKPTHYIEKYIEIRKFIKH